MTVHHVALEAGPADGEALAGFFELLGFVRVEPPAALAERSLWLRAPAEGGSVEGTQVHVLFADGAAVAPPAGHVAVVCADYDAALERLRAAGFAIDPRAEHWGARRCFVQAPGGHRVEIMASPPA